MTPSNWTFGRSAVMTKSGSAAFDILQREVELALLNCYGVHGNGVAAQARPEEKHMKVFGFQFDIAWENKQANFAKVRELVDRASPETGSLMVLPEMFATGFSMNVAGIAEGHAGLTENFLSGLARERSCWVMGGAAVRSGDGLVHNKCLVFSPDGTLAACYAKMRPFSPGGEKQHYRAGERISTFEWKQCKVAPFVCYDLRFPELFRAAAQSCRPQLYTVIASWPSKRASHWIKLLQARAIENQAYVIGVNRIGADPFYTYVGQSLIVDPQGELVSDAGEMEGFVSAELDLSSLTQYREGLPFLDDMAFAPGLVSECRPNVQALNTPKHL